MTQPQLATQLPTRESNGASGRAVLSQALLERIAARASEYDRQNRFFFEDLEELKSAGWLRAVVPRDLGGLGATLPDFVREQTRLAYHGPSTALALNMHQYWVGAALHLRRQGDHSAEWILTEAASGKIFAAGHGEPGNDLGLATSFVHATPQPDGSYRFSGRKIFTSLSPVWDWLGLHGLDNTDPANPKVVHAFIRRDAPGIKTVETWDAVGLRATRSDDTLLENVVAAPEHVLRVLPAGPPADPLIEGILGWVLPGIGAVYHGIAKRAFDLAVTGAQQRKSALLEGKPFAHAPFTQWSVAQAAIELDAVEALVERVARDFWDGVAHGPHWAAKLLAAKQHAVDAARRIVDQATKVAGAGSLFRTQELERLYRDVRAGAFHPPNTDAAYDIIGKTYLGVL
jgi:alkylation response protein AidB-like acyl-CoA dehydrogenase